MQNFFKRFNPLKTGIIGSLTYAKLFQTFQSAQNGNHRLAGRRAVLLYVHPGNFTGRVGRGLADGLSRLCSFPRAVHLFGIDRVWILPPIENGEGII